MNWDWAAACLGLGPTQGIFAPAFWRLSSYVTGIFGAFPNSGMTLLLLVLLMLFLWSMFFWSEKRWPHWVAFGLSGALSADTPYVIVLPVLVCQVSILATRLSFEYDLDLCKVEISWRAIFRSWAVGFVTVFCLNFLQFGFQYPPGYANNAMAVVSNIGLRHPKVSAAMDDLLRRYAEEVVREADGRTWLFTDGTCDAAIATMAYRQGKCVRTLPLVGRGAEGSCLAWSGLSRPADLAALRGGTGGLMRSWLVDYPDKLNQAAFLNGIAFLEKASREPVVAAGLVWRTGSDVSAEERQRVTQVLKSLAEDIVGFYRQMNPVDGGAVRMRRLESMQWQVARALRRQVEILALSTRNSPIHELVELAMELDRNNQSQDRVREAERLATNIASAAVTAHEGLARALKNNDYALASRYAERVLQEEPDNADANFALGMDGMNTKKYAQAYYYLDKAHQGRPQDVAILNNMALVSLELGNVEAAEEAMRKAQALAPDSKEVKEVISRILAAKAKVN